MVAIASCALVNHFLIQLFENQVGRIPGFANFSQIQNYSQFRP